MPAHADTPYDGLPIGVYRTDADGALVHVNDRWSAMTGIAPERAARMGWADALHPDDREAALREWRRAVADGRELVCDIRVAAADGTTRWASVRSVTVRDDAGAVVGHLGSVTPLEGSARESERLQQLIVANLTDVIYFLDMDRRLRYVTPSYETLTGHRVDEAAGRLASGRDVHPDDLRRMSALWQRLWEGEGYTGAEFRIRTADGREAWCSSAGSPVLDDDGTQVGVQIRDADITARRRMEERLRQSEERARSIVDTTSEAFVSTDADGLVMEWNGAAQALFGWEIDEASGQRFVDIVLEGPDLERVAAAMDAYREHGDTAGLLPGDEVRARRRDGRELIAEMTLWAVGTGDECGFNALMSDITERKEREQAVRHMAFHDRLTGLPNRTQLESALPAALERASVEGRAAALLYMDVDQFKRVNDTLGHDAGDELLRQVAHRLRRAARSSDMVVRLGGDEFVIVLTDLAADASCRIARDVAGRIHEGFRPPFMLPGEEFATTISIGIGVFPDHAGDAESLVKAADEAMYASKRAGRGLVSMPGERADPA